MSQLPTEVVYGAAIAAFRAGRDGEAIELFKELIGRSPRTAEYHNALGTVLARGGLTIEARQSFETAIAISPNFAAAYYNLGNVLAAERAYEPAVKMYRRAIDRDAQSAEAFNNLGTALLALNNTDEAIDAYKRAILIRPRLVAATLALGALLRDTGQLDESIDCYRRFLALGSDWRVGSGLLYSMLFHPGYDAKQLYDEHVRWDETYARSLAGPPLSSVDRSGSRRLRIGYVSTDFRQHVVGYNLLPLFRAHNRTDFEVIAYSSVAVADSMTERFKELADTWRDIRLMDDQSATDLIRKDRIDILVDTSLHMADHRLLVFARKPAPVQVTFAGYPGTTGLRAIDYRLTDPFLDPPHRRDDRRYSEASMRLGRCFWCFDALGEASLPVSPAPSASNGFVTFGYLGAFAKISEPTVEMWARVLGSVAGSRMLILAPRGSARTRVAERFAVGGIPATSIGFADRKPRRQYLELYSRIDVFLDTLPYNGHSTSLDALWMGVPVVTLAGDQVVSRAGLSILSNLGMQELVAEHSDDFVRVASGLANDANRLNSLRMTMRGKMLASPLMDATLFTRDVEAAYRQMWRGFCQGDRAADVAEI